MAPIKKQNKQYSEEDLLHAIQAVKNGTSQYTAARMFGIPRATLFFKVNGKNPIGKNAGAPTVLSAKEEKMIVDWIFEIASVGFPTTKHQMILSVQTYLNKLKRKTPFTNNLPGKKWYSAFLKRHPKVAERTSQSLTKARAAITETNIRLWHADVESYLTKNNLNDILNDPSRLFNLDESAFYLNPKGDLVLTRKGDKAVYKRCSNDPKECITTLIGGSAAGVVAPPVVVFPYKRIPGGFMADFPKDWALGISDSGWMTGPLFFEYIANTFHKWLIQTGVQLPVILFVDGHTSHMTYILSEFCKNHGIILIAFYPNATHLLQPMDVAVFKPLKVEWKKVSDAWRLKYNGARIEKREFAKLLHEALQNTGMESHLKSGFEACGLYPFDANSISYDRILKSPKAVPISNERNCDIIDLEIEPSLDYIRLMEFEKNINEALLSDFNECEGDWDGQPENTGLFKIWKGLKNKTVITLQPDNIVAIINNSEVINGVAEVQNNDADMHSMPMSTNNEYDELIDQTESNHIGQLINRVTPEEIVFKDTFFYPKESIKKSKAINTVKMPSIMTSNEWLQLEKARIDKQKLEENEKNHRKELREAKKNESDRIKLIKKKEREAKKIQSEQDKSIKKINNTAKVVKKLNVRGSSKISKVDQDSTEAVTKESQNIHDELEADKENGVMKFVPTKSTKRKIQPVKNTKNKPIKKLCLRA